MTRWSAGRSGAPDERDRAHRRLVGVAREADDLAPEHRARHGEVTDLGQQRRPHLRILHDHLEACLAAVLGVATALEDHDRVSGVAEQVEPERHRGALVVRPGGDVEPVLPLTEPSPLRVGDEVAQRAVVPLVAAADPEQAGVVISFGDLGQRDVDVDPPVDVDLLHHHRQLVGPRARCSSSTSSSAVPRGTGSSRVSCLTSRARCVRSRSSPRCRSWREPRDCRGRPRRG